MTLPARVISWVATLLLAGAASAQSLDKVFATCPLDGQSFSVQLPAEMSARGPLDFELRPRTGDATLATLITCPKCGFTTTRDRYEAGGELDAKKVQAALAAMRTSPLFRPVDAAIIVEQNTTNDARRIAELSLAAKRLADLTGEPDVVRQRTLAAIDAHKALVANLAGPVKGETDPNAPADRANSAAEAMYLVGELFRQLGQSADAVAGFDKARPNMPDRTLGLLECQAFRAKWAGKPATDILAEANSAIPAARVGAAFLLANDGSPASVEFLKKTCAASAGDHNLAGVAVTALMDAPASTRDAVLPVLLADGEPAIVDAAALVIAKTRTKGYAVAIVAALKARAQRPRAPGATQQPTPGLLGAALVAAASLDNIDAVLTLSDADLPAGWRARALAATGSPKAAPPIVKLLKVDPTAAAGNEPLLAKLGADLIQQLPDLKSAAGDDPAAALRTRLLGSSDERDAKDQLAAILPATDADTPPTPLQLEAAAALVRLGDPRGKPLVLASLHRLIAEGTGAPLPSPDLAGLFVMLKADDFDAINAQVQSAIDATRAVHARRANCRPNYGAYDASSEIEVLLLLEFLAATRNQQSADTVLGYWPNLHGLDAPVVGAMLRLYPADKQIAKRIDDDFATMSEPAQARVMRRWAELKDASHVPAMLKLVERPTTIALKREWLAAMNVLDPAKAADFAKKWNLR